MIITSPLILTLRSDSELARNGAIAIERGTILAVGPRDMVIRKYPRHHIYSFPNAALMPGLVNAHTHLELPLMIRPSRTENYAHWVLRLLRAKSRLSRENLRYAVTENIETLITSGTTTVAEICTHGISPDILRKSGMRTVVYFEIIAMQPTGWEKAVPAFPAWRSGLVHFGLSPHTPHTVSKAVLTYVRDRARRNALPLCMHIAETADELMLLRGKPGSLDTLYRAAGWQRAWAPLADSAFRYLDGLRILGKRFLAVHAVHTDDADIAVIKRSGTGIAHCPRSNRELSRGKMPLKKFLDARIPVGIGTDSLASAPSLNLWEEMRFAHQIHRRSGITPEDIIHLATLGGARALGMDHEIGSLEPGKKADIIAVPLPRKNTGDLYSDLLRETKSCIMSMVNGKIIYHPNNSERT